MRCWRGLVADIDSGCMFTGITRAANVLPLTTRRSYMMFCGAILLNTVTFKSGLTYTLGTGPGTAAAAVLLATERSAGSPASARLQTHTLGPIVTPFLFERKK